MIAAGLEDGAPRSFCIRIASDHTQLRESEAMHDRAFNEERACWSWDEIWKRDGDAGCTRMVMLGT